jgi:hypothetical protein
LRHSLCLALALSALSVACFVRAADSGPESQESRVTGIKSLHLRLIPGDMPTYYSPHARARAVYLQGLLGGEIEYYSKVFHVAFSPITLAVLDTRQWPAVAGDEPYGMPSVDGTKPAVFVMPVSWDEVKWMVVPKRKQVPPAMLRKALSTGEKWDQIKFQGCDGIGTHEIGHSIIRQLGIDPQTKWFNEFLASYAGYAYLKANAPAHALSSEIFWTAGLGNSPHPFTKLDDFESKYEQLQQEYPGNYGWYQLALDQRVIEVFAQKGVTYLQEIRNALPSGAAKLDGAQLISKLERISPGWTAWAAHLEAGDVKAALSPASGR